MVGRAGRRVVPGVPGPAGGGRSGAQEKRETGEQEDSPHRAAEPIILREMTTFAVMVRVRAARAYCAPAGAPS